MAVFIIAEAGVNHDGDLIKALRLIDAAADAGADAVKFQTFDPSELATRSAPLATYQHRATDPAGAGDDAGQHGLLERLRLSPEDHHRLADHCADRGIEFMSTPFDLPSLRFLTDDMGLTRIKLSSPTVVHGPMLIEAGRSSSMLILSTGMATEQEVRTALGAIAFGGTEVTAACSVGAFAEAFASTAGQAVLSERVALLHCTSCYPADVADLNLNAMVTMQREFGLPVGYSDHSLSDAVPVAAASLGASIIEKHLTLDRNDSGPDHAASMEPAGLERMIAQVRETERALGSSDKSPTASEAETAAVARYSLVTIEPVARGAPFTPRNLGVKRPGNGDSPMNYWSRLGQLAERDYDADEVVMP